MTNKNCTFYSDGGMTTVGGGEQGLKVSTEDKGHGKHIPSPQTRPIQFSVPNDSDSDLKHLKDTAFNILWSLWGSW